ncbi:MAG: hydrogenase maturation nickel metallochaperone HypA [Butyrivibrio sp.]|nr:hydrogenase maturation nickel metallochaperone HypA [Butyrivibrio sp.]
MHELSYMIKMVNLAEDTAIENDIEHIDKIVVEVGAMTGVLPYYLHKYYPEATKGTRLEGSELEVIEIPVKAICNNCQTEYEPTKENDYRCPHCTSTSSHIVAGRDVTLKNILVNE